MAKSGLGLKELEFNIDGNAMRIHNVILDAFSELNDCGGYTLHRLATNSTDLIAIKPPKGGFTVKYLKDIVKSAKLFVRPLQADIIFNDSDEEVSITITRYYFNCQDSKSSVSSTSQVLHGGEAFLNDLSSQ